MTLRIAAKVTLIAATLPFLAACESLVGSDNLNQLAEKGKDVREDTKKGIGKAVDTYCGNVPLTARLSLRAEVNDYAEEGRIIIECKKDEQ